MASGGGYDGGLAFMGSLPLTLREIAEAVGGSVEGDASAVVSGVAAVDEAGASDLTFADAKHAAALANSSAGAAIVGADGPDSAPMALIRVGDVEEALARLLGHLAPPEDLPPAGVDPSSSVDATARLGDHVAVGPRAVVSAGATVGDRSVLCAGAFVGREAAVGSDTVLAEGVVVRYGCRVGDRVRIGCNSVIGYDGFGYRAVGGVHEHIPHAGNVVIEDGVQIGACTCVDRAKFGSTVIGAGAIVDDLVMVAHNCRVGAGSVLVAQVGLAGSVKLGRYVVLAGKVGVADNITMGDGAQVGGFSAVHGDLEAGGRYLGVPAIPAKRALRAMQAFTRVPELIKRVRTLEKRLESIESSEDD